MSNPPGGEVTFLFSDIAGATRLWEEQPGAMQAALPNLEALVRPLVTALGGNLFKAVAGAYYASFVDPSIAVATALTLEWACSNAHWQELRPELRIAIHTGPADFREGDYFGATLNRTARILAAAHGGQILISASAVAALNERLPDGCTLLDLGERRLKDIPAPERIYQLVAPDLPASFPPLNTLDRRPTNLPAPPTAFVGRERELAEITTLLRRPDVRLITMTGPGGSGKTRLSIKVGSAMLDEFAAGVYFVPLSSSTTPAMVATAIGQSLGLKENANQAPLDALKEHLSDKHMLLMLDNFEQVMDAAALVTDLLASASQLKVIVTSRIVLRVPGEHEYLVPPLDLPTSPLPTLEKLSQYAAVALFIQRARAVRPDFAVSNANAPAVAQICTLLDGLPLAIELAAARSRDLSLDEILARLDDRLNLLTSAFRDLPARQRTIRGAIDWSYDLLDADAQRLFRRLGIFVGGWTLDAASAVVNADDEPEIDVAAGLASLIDKSLMRQGAGADGEIRFSRLGVIREYALEKLAESSEEDAVRRRHAEYYLGLAEQAEPELTGAEQAYWLNRLDEEHDNLRAALNWSLTNDSTLGVSLAGALGRFWRVRGHINEGRRWLEAVLQDSEQVSPTVKAKAFFWAGAIEGDFSYSLALEMLEKALRLFREGGDVGGVARTLNLLGIVVQDNEDYERAAGFYEESLQLQRELGDKHGIAVALANLAWVELNRGNYQATIAMEEESQQLLRELGDQFNLAMGISNLGNVALLTDEYGQAIARYEESIAMHRELGNARGIALALFFLSLTKLFQGGIGEAREAGRESLTMLRELEADSDIPITIWGMAGIASAEGEARRAAVIFGAAEAQLKIFGASLPPAINPLYTRLLDVTRLQLDEASFDAAWAEGQAMTLEQVVTYALQQGR